jgi:hypothetical protein
MKLKPKEPPHRRLATPRIKSKDPMLMDAARDRRLLTRSSR